MDNTDAQLRLRDIAQAISRGDILPAIQRFRDFNATYKYASDLSFIDSVESDYQMMLRFYRQGLADADREQIFKNIKKRLVRAYGNLSISYLRQHNVVMSTSFARIAGKGLDAALVRQQLEEQVSSIAMLSLEPQTVSEEKSEALHTAHFEILRQAFNVLFTSEMWSRSEKEDWTALLLSPTIDITDSLVMTSALMLGCLMQFDIYKFQTLTEVYTYASDERLRQRALVGWILAMSREEEHLYPEQTDIVRRLLLDERCRQEVGEVGLQMFYCMDADKDTKEIQRDIMPGLMKNSNLKMSERGFGLKEDEDVEDILHPDAQDKAMEELEKGYQHMMDMQRRGSDIYFGGFAQMKRFSFFYSLVNWFMPFYPEHPELRHIIKKLPNTQVLNAFVKDNPFCDSDKYSFALALSSVIDKIPKNVLEMLEQGELRQNMSVLNEQRATPRFIRQMYLQDLYRFFRLFVQKDALPKIFSANQLRGIPLQPSDAAFFIDHPAFRVPAMDEQKKIYLRFLMKRHMIAEVKRVADSFVDTVFPDLLMAKVAVLMNDRNHMMQAEPLLLQMLHDESHHAYALRMLGKIYREKGDFKSALVYYEQLTELYPDSRSYLFNYCFCLVELDEATARQRVFELVYKFPDDVNGLRLLAWDYLRKGEFQKAFAEYAKLLNQTTATKADYVNMGYCHWFAGEIEQALTSFEQAVGISHVDEVIRSIEDDEALITKFVSSEAEVLLMKDLIRSSVSATP